LEEKSEKKGRGREGWWRLEVGGRESQVVQDPTVLIPGQGVFGVDNSKTPDVNF